MCNQELKEHPRDITNRLQLLTDLYFSDFFRSSDKGNEGHSTKATWSPTAFAVFNRITRSCRRSNYVTRPKDFHRWIDLAVQDTENEKFKEQKAGLQKSTTDEIALRQVELGTLVQRLELEVLV